MEHLFLMSHNYVSLYPTQMDVTFTEKCNQNCDYCWVNKSNPHVLNFNSIKKGIDIFLNFPLEEQTITFTASEPLVSPRLYQKTIDYIVKKTRYKKKKVHIVTTTNGINLNEELRCFMIGIARDYNDFRLNISLDGKPKSHDAHRKFKDKIWRSTSAISWKNFFSLPREIPRVIFTITPSEVYLFKENIKFIFSQGFKKIDLFPQMFTLWGDRELEYLREGLGWLINYVNDELKDYDIRILNRLWGASHYNKLLLSCDSNFYLFEWILTIPYSERKRYIIGNTREGINIEKRLVLFNRLFKYVMNETNNKCSECSYGNICFYPLPLFLWCRHNGKEFNKYFKNFCQIAEIFIKCSQKIKNESRNILDTRKLEKINMVEN